MILIFDLGHHNSPTFADGTRTRPSRSLGLRTYVLARFDSDVSFEWVKRARSFLVKDELKYRDLVAASFDLVLGRFPPLGGHDLGRLLVREASTAVIFLVDSESYAQTVFRTRLNDGAEFARDFGFREVINEAAERMIRDIPLYRMRPHEIVEVLEPFSTSNYRFRSDLRFDLSSSVEPDTPQILSQIGGKLRDAELFTARAYSLLDFDDKAEAYGDYYTNPYFRSSTLGRGFLRKALSVPRVFDRDHAASVKVLNESINVLQRNRPQPQTNYEQMVKEEDSRTIDALQAADIAAGFARDILDRKGLRALAAQFRKVILNGINLCRLRTFN
jgi:hypothetical protein